MMGLSAAAAGAAALSPVLDWSAYAKKEQLKGPIGIVGGGVAGLTAAYRLQKHHAKPMLFEASNRWGGRMFTKCNFYKGMFCERGGELVDSDHLDLKNLLHELGLKRQKLPDEGEALYFFKGKFRTEKDILDRKMQCGAYVPIAEQIRKDHSRLKDKQKNWTAHARDLDGISLKKYLEQFRGKVIGGKNIDDWVIDLLELAYVNENGLEAEDQSSLNLVDFIGTALNEDFQLYGDSDEAYRIEGGSSVLINALVNALKDKTEMKLNYALTELDYQGGQIVMGFDAPGGVQTQNFDAVILALPFTKLRQVKGLDRLNLSPEKLKCINELGMGQHAKIMVGTTSRVWRKSAPETGLPLADGGFLSDVGVQDFWETSAGQQPTEAEAGILTVFLGGNAADHTKTDQKSVLTAFHDGLHQIWPKMAESLDMAAVMSMFWSKYPYTLGSYCAAKVGQYTTMLDEAGRPALGGRLQFAGEHTAGAKRFGFMNGGVLSGNRAAHELVKLMALPPQEAVRHRHSSPATGVSVCQESPGL
jgi:monoamine oxidase